MTNQELILSFAGTFFSLFLVFYGQRMLTELREFRLAFVKYQVSMEKRMSTVEVKVNVLEREKS